MSNFKQNAPQLKTLKDKMLYSVKEKNIYLLYFVSLPGGC